MKFMYFCVLTLALTTLSPTASAACSSSTPSSYVGTGWSAHNMCAALPGVNVRIDDMSVAALPDRTNIDDENNVVITLANGGELYVYAPWTASDTPATPASWKVIDSVVSMIRPAEIAVDSQGVVCVAWVGKIAGAGGSSAQNPKYLEELFYTVFDPSDSNIDTYFGEEIYTVPTVYSPTATSTSVDATDYATNHSVGYFTPETSYFMAQDVVIDLEPSFELHVDKCDINFGVASRTNANGDDVFCFAITTNVRFTDTNFSLDGRHHYRSCYYEIESDTGISYGSPLLDPIISESEELGDPEELVEWSEDFCSVGSPTWASKIDVDAAGDTVAVIYALTLENSDCSPVHQSNLLDEDGDHYFIITPGTMGTDLKTKKRTENIGLSDFSGQRTNIAVAANSSTTKVFIPEDLDSTGKLLVLDVTTPSNVLTLSPTSVIKSHHDFNWARTNHGGLRCDAAVTSGGEFIFYFTSREDDDIISYTNVTSSSTGSSDMLRHRRANPEVTGYNISVFSPDNRLFVPHEGYMSGEYNHVFYKSQLP